MTAPYIRLDTLQQVEPKALLWGPSLKSSVFVKTGWLSRTQKPGQVPYMQLRVGSTEAVRLVSAKGLEARAAQIVTLWVRHGGACFYCGCDLSVDTCSIEHILPKSAGGPDHIANMALSCQPCNRAAGALSVFEKVNLAIRSRLGEMAMAAGGGR
jgi:hypothetical protein